MGEVVNINRHEPYDVYIGRPSKWGNPYRPSQYGRGQTLVMYRRWLWHELRSGRITHQELAALKGKRLGCYCAPLACHGNVLLRAAEWAAKEIGPVEPSPALWDAEETIYPGDLVALVGSDEPLGFSEVVAQSPSDFVAVRGLNGRSIHMRGCHLVPIRDEDDS